MLFGFNKPMLCSPVIIRTPEAIINFTFNEINTGFIGVLPSPGPQNPLQDQNSEHNSQRFHISKIFSFTSGKYLALEPEI